MREPRRLPVSRSLEHEALEPRLVMSAEPLGQITLDPFEQQDETAPQTLLAEAHQQSGLAQARSEYGLTGAGQTVVVIDTGIGYDHQALGGGFGAGHKVVGGWDFAENDANPYDDGPLGSHGTHVAGIIGSTDERYPGVAPGADLVALRVFDDNGQSSFAWIEQALLWIHENRNSFANPITTVNISIGATWNSSSIPSWATLEDELALLEADGIFVAVAAGNSFASYNTPGLSYPAASSHVVPVASVDDNGNLSYFSQRDSRVIAAPGRTILSTVPDYRGNQNTQQDDFVSYSGTSMASPYVAGAAVLVREAYAFAGQPDVDQATIYNLMRSTADTVYDPVTGQSYYRLNVDRALDAVMPADDYGSTTATAHGLGTLGGDRTLTGHIARLDDRDFFSFTAGNTGRVTLTVDATGQFAPSWTLPSGATATGATVSIDVVAGQSYTFGLGGAGAVTHYTIDIGMEGASGYVDWGKIKQQGFNNQQIVGQTEFAMTASRDGLLTVEAFFQNSGGNIDLQLYDSSGRLVGSSAGSGNVERIDVTAAKGQQFTLRVAGVNDDVDFRLTNCVELANGTLTVRGTPGDDVLSFTAGEVHRVEVNGLSYSFDATGIQAVQLRGGRGNNAAIVVGTAGNDTVTADGDLVNLTASGLTIEARKVATATVYGGGGTDSATLYGTTGNDRLVARPGDVQLTGGGLSYTVYAFGQVQAYAREGTDTATLYDSAGNDTLDARLAKTRLYGVGFDHTAHGFDVVQGYASTGDDLALLYDTSGNDVLTAQAGYARMTGPGLDVAVYSFDRVRAYATLGADEARLTITRAGEQFVNGSGYTRLTGAGYETSVYLFETVGQYTSPAPTATARASAVETAFSGEPLSAAARAQALADWARQQLNRLPPGIDADHFQDELQALDQFFRRLGRRR